MLLGQAVLLQGVFLFEELHSNHQRGTLGQELLKKLGQVDVWHFKFHNSERVDSHDV